MRIYSIGSIYAQRGILAFKNNKQDPTDEKILFLQNEIKRLKDEEAHYVQVQEEVKNILVRNRQNQQKFAMMLDDTLNGRD